MRDNAFVIYRRPGLSATMLRPALVLSGTATTPAKAPRSPTPQGFISTYQRGGGHHQPAFTWPDTFL